MAFSIKCFILLLAISSLNIGNTQASFWDKIPFISQAKSVVQLATGDHEGAAETQRNFISTPIHLVNSAGQAIAGDGDGALDHIKKITKPQGTYWTNLRFSKGDILECSINFFANHMMLATSSDTVAHMKGNTDTGRGWLEEETWDSYHHGEGDEQTICRKSGRAESPYLAVEKAREDIREFGRRRIYYNLLTCNCEHWVNRWAKGAAVSLQSLHPASPYCDA